MKDVCFDVDGTRLRGVLAPARAPRGTIVIRTPYDAHAHTAQAAGWAERGWNALVLDVRGRHTSDGAWEPYTHEGEDGLATAQAVLTSSWHTGEVVLAGASYAGYCALETAATAREHDPQVYAALAAVVVSVPVLGAWESAHDPSGLPRLRDRLGWWHQHGFARTTGPGLSTDEMHQLENLAIDMLRAGAAAGLAGLLRAAGYPTRESGLWHRLMTTPAYPGRRRGHQVPLLVISGAYDFFAEEAAVLAREWGSADVGYVSGPWGHALHADVSPSGPVAAAARSRGTTGQIAWDWLTALPRPHRRRLVLPTGSSREWLDTPTSAATVTAYLDEHAAVPREAGALVDADVHAVGTAPAHQPVPVPGPAGGDRWARVDLSEVGSGGQRDRLLTRSAACSCNDTVYAVVRPVCHQLGPGAHLRVTVHPAGHWT